MRLRAWAYGAPGAVSTALPTMRKEETRRKLMGNACVNAKRGAFGTTLVDELMASMGLNAGAIYGHFPTKEAAYF